jgi:uncharacterized protein YcbK (DUF882 family)
MSGLKIPAPDDRISRHFVWREALWLPRWNRMANESDGLNQQTLDNLTWFFKTIDLVREYFASSMIVHVCYRPKEYNELVGGAKNSAHLALLPGEAAIDFHVSGMACDDAREKIMKDNKLEDWKLRMEKMPGSNWVHLDSRKPTLSRYFIP